MASCTLRTLPLSSPHVVVVHPLVRLPLCHLSWAALREPLLPVSVTNLRNTSALSSHWLEEAPCFAASDSLMGSISLVPQAWRGWVSLMVNTDALGEPGDSASLSGKLLIAVTPGSRSITLFYRHLHFSSKWWPEDAAKMNRCYNSRDLYRHERGNNGWESQPCALSNYYSCSRAPKTDSIWGQILFPVD